MSLFVEADSDSVQKCFAVVPVPKKSDHLQSFQGLFLLRPNRIGARSQSLRRTTGPSRGLRRQLQSNSAEDPIPPSTMNSWHFVKFTIRHFRGAQWHFGCSPWKRSCFAGSPMKAASLQENPSRSRRKLQRQASQRGLEPQMVSQLRRGFHDHRTMARHFNGNDIRLSAPWRHTSRPQQLSPRAIPQQSLVPRTQAVRQGGWATSNTLELRRIHRNSTNPRGISSVTPRRDPSCVATPANYFLLRSFRFTATHSAMICATTLRISSPIVFACFLTSPRVSGLRSLNSTS